MPKVPPCILVLLIDLPEQQIDIVCRNLKITETIGFKKYLTNNATPNKSCKDFLIKELSSSNTTTIQAIYNKIEGFLFIGGCAPGFGIAFNIIDACFCFALGNMFGCFVAIISCFPIPGFKVAGKGIEKFLIYLFDLIPISELTKFTKELPKRIGNYCGHNNGDYVKALEVIYIKLNEIMALKNPFVSDEKIKAFTKIINRFHTILPDNIQKNIPQSYSVSDKQIKLLGITERSIK